jgi:hypothetical protein
VVLGAHLERLPAAEHDAFVRAVAGGLPEPVIDYVRLNIVANPPLTAHGVRSVPVLQGSFGVTG